MNNFLDSVRQENECWQNIAKSQALQITRLEDRAESFTKLVTKAMAEGQEANALTGEPVLVIRKSYLHNLITEPKP